MAVRSRTSRAPACALVDGALLLDGHDGIERAAARAGRDLRDVRQVLLTGTQQHAPGWLAAVGGTAPVQVVGPPAALEPLRSLGERVRLVPLSPGALHETPSGYGVLAVQPGAWAVSSPDGSQLLYAPGSAAGGVATARPYDLVLLGVGGQDRPASTLAQLRRDGSVGSATEVCALGYDHAAELPDVLQHHLAGWGVRETVDGTVVLPGSPEHAPLPGRTLVLGGARSGKSALAEQLLAAHPHVTYVATGGSRDGDGEWQQRVATHRERRPASWRTVETTDLVTCLREADGAVLIDCLGTWLTDALDRHGVWTGMPVAAVEADVDELLAAWRACAVPVVAVSNEVGSGVVPATSSGRLFRDLLGRVNAQVAAQSETVLLTVAGIPVPLRTPGRP